jgi:carbon monoxide dehydrogenase subunit G
MEFSTQYDVEAPIEFVWTQASNFTMLERQALRRGAEVKRKDSLATPGVRAEWDIRFQFRSKYREVNAKITSFDVPNRYTVMSTSGSIDGVCVVDLVALSPKRTRLTVTFDLTAKSLGSRLMLQSLKMAKSGLNTRFEDRVASMARDIQDRYRATQGGGASSRA